MTTKHTAVLVPCRINVDAFWDNACIHDVGNKTLIVSSPISLKTGDYLQIRRGTLTIIGRVTWLRGGRIGIATQDPVDVHALIDEARLLHRPAGLGEGDRRRQPRPARAARLTPPRAPAEQAERSRRTASLLQYAAITLATGGGAYLLATQLYLVLAVPFTRIYAALGG